MKSFLSNLIAVSTCACCFFVSVTYARLAPARLATITARGTARRGAAATAAPEPSRPADFKAEDAMLAMIS